MQNYAWRSWGVFLGMCIATLALLTSCGGGNGSPVNGNDAVSDAPAGGAVAGGPTQTITEDEVSSLPAWQQDLLADPGWNQPTIPQRADTPMPSPSYEMLLDWQAKAQQDGIISAARGSEGAKGASWIGDSPWVPTTAAINRGEYNIPFSAGGSVPYGCKDTTGTNNHMKEKKLAAEPIPVGANQAITYVLKGISNSNHFNTTGGSSNNALCAVYQIWSSKRNADPTQPYSSYSPPSSAPLFAEVSYRADGGPNAGGNPCNAVAAYTVQDFIWWKYNQQNFNALPGLNTTALYNILIAPSSNQTASKVSSGNTTGRMQNFYCGNVSVVYGGGAIVTIESSTSTCATFKDSIAGQRLFYTNPIYGVLLQRWNDSVLKSMQSPNNNPWNGDFGWPVQGPTAYNNGASTLTGNGAYYAWGMYFEKGFCWWIDYINNTNVPDEAQAYSYTGANVFCKGATDKYEKLPTIYYGGTGPLGVSVIVEASLNPDRGAGSPPAGTFYEVGNPAAPAPTLVLDMHAHGYGGAARAADGHYKYYTWAFRDGTIGVTNGVAYDDSTKYVQHSYTLESVYTVRVQVVDSNNLVGYGDSLPIHVGTGAGGGGSAPGQIWLVRADDATNNGSFGDFPAGYNAIKASLTAKGVSFTEKDYSASVGTDFQADATAKVMIFYRGGPGAAGEPTPFTASFPTAQQNMIKTVLNSGTKRRVLFIGQGEAYQNFNMGGNNTWTRFHGCSQVAANSTDPVGDIGNWGTNIIGQGRGYNTSSPGWYTVGSDTSESFCLQNYNGAITAGLVNALSANAAERYAGAGSSGKIPVVISIASRQFSSGCDYNGFDSIGWWQASTNWKAGLHATNASGGSEGFLTNYCTISQGNSAAPGIPTGTGKIWCWQFSFSDTTVTSPSGMNKDDLLQNVLAWLDPTITFSAKTNGGFQEYSGNPEIVSVTPAYWDEANHNYVTGGQTSPWNGTGASTGRFPDQSSTNMYRTTAGNPVNAVLTTDPNNNWVNGNDVDFQQNMYAYIDRGANGLLETGGSAPSWNSTDDSVSYGGVLAADPDGSWQRLAATPSPLPSIMLKEEANNTFNRNPMPVVCGYYQSTGVGSAADDVKANYGTDLDAFSATATNWANSAPLSMECLARWPSTLKYFNWSGPGGQAPNAPDAYLVWQVYPGQGNTIPTGPNAGKFIGLNANWEESRREFDVDVANGWSVPGRDNTSAWNRPSFSFQDATTQGRAISFNFRKLKTWNGDQNRDGTLDVQDKFPVRVRLFTNHQAYYNKVVLAGNPGWPNHLADAGGDPATTPLASRNPSYLEGGTYVVDKGSPVYNVQITDDPNAADPGQPGTLTGQGPGSYTAKLQFLIKYGAPNYLIEADTWYTGIFGANNGVPIVTVKAAATPPNTEGPYNITINVPAAQPNGNYQFAIKVTDGNGDTSLYVWPGIVGLFPQALLAENFEDGTLNKWTVGGTIGQNYDGYRNMSMDWRNVTSAGYQKGFNTPYWGTPNGSNMTPPQGSRMGAFSDGANDSNTASPIGTNRYIELATAVPCVNGQTYTLTCKTNGMAYYESTTSTYCYGGLIPEISFNGGTSWYNNNYGPPSYSPYSSNFTGAIICYAYYPYNGTTAYYPWAWVSNTNASGGQWKSRSCSFTATGASFKIRFRFASYQGYYSPYPTLYYIANPMAIDDILVQ